MFEEADNFADIFRGGLPYYLLLTLPILIICSSSPILASSEFSVQRMSQYDINGVAYGCRASALSLEAKSLYSWSTSRHCVVVKFQDLTIDHFRDIRQKAGGLVILLPKNVATMTFEEKEHLYLLEQAMLDQVSNIPIYFSTYNEELETVIEDITVTSDANAKASQGQAQRESAISELLNSISANGYQIVVTGASHSANKASKIPIIQGELIPMKNVKSLDGNGNGKLPQIIITAHLNTFGLYNEYPLNSDAAVLMMIAELFNKLYNSVNAAPKYRLLFLLTEAGAMLNFQGAKKWLDENIQLQEDIVSITGHLIATRKANTIITKNVDFVLCLDTITQALNSNSEPLYMHVSKPPKEGSAMNNFYKVLKSVATQYNNVTVDGVHKKINLADLQLAWEHERFSMKRLPSFTLSSLKSPRQPIRNTIFKESDHEIIRNTQKNAKVIAEALARYMYRIDEGEIFSGAIEISKNLIKSHLNLKSAQHNNDLKNVFEKFLKVVKITHDKPDLREPDFMFYDGQEANLYVYRVKPAVFDLFLTILICAYLTSVYFMIQYFPTFYSIVCKMTKQSSANGFQQSSKVKSN